MEVIIYGLVEFKIETEWCKSEAITILLKKNQYQI